MNDMSMMTDIKDRFAMQFEDRLALAQRRSELSVQEIAERIQVHRNTVGAWMNGRNRPRRRDLVAFALVTGYPVEWLETGKVPHDGGTSPTVPPTGVEPATYGTNVRRFAAVTPIFGERAA